jgi:mannose-1-phosphate guanylyltransferase
LFWCHAWDTVIDMKAIILVGGGGTRLRPLTHSTPKALVPVLNRPLLEYLLRHLGAHGINEIVLATSVDNAVIETHFGDGSRLGLNISYAYEYEPLGSGGAVREAARGITDTFLVCNGDIITSLNLTDMLAAHRREGALVTISLTSVDDPSRYGVADVGSDGRISRFVEKPPPELAPSNWINGGAWIFEARALERFPEGRDIILDGWVERVLFPGIIASGDLLYGYRSEDYWVDVGTPETYVRVQHDLLHGKLPDFLPAGAEESLIAPDAIIHPDARITGPVLIGPGCRIGGLAEIVGPSVLGAGCTVRDRAHIEKSILWNHAKIGSGATVAGSVVGQRALVGDGAVVEDSLLGDESGVKRGHVLPAGTRLAPGVVVPSEPAENKNETLGVSP